MKNKIIKKITIGLTILLSTSLVGCKSVESSDKDKLKKSYNWVQNNQFVLNKKNEYKNNELNNIKNKEEGNVILNYQFYDEKLNKDNFVPLTDLKAQSSMLNLYSKADINKSKLIADNMIKNIREGKIKVKGNEIKLYYIIPQKEYTDKWEIKDKTIEVETQLEGVKALLNVYDKTKEKKYLDNGLKVLNSIIDISENNRYILPYEYIKESDDKYKIDNVAPFFLLKTIYESSNLAYNITKDNRYLAFRNNSYMFVKFGLENINANGKEMIPSGINLLNNSYLNRNDIMFAENEKLYNTEDMLKTLIGISYYDKEYAKTFLPIVKAMEYNTKDSRVLAYLTHKGTNNTKFKQTKKNYLNIYSSILRFEYLNNIKADKTNITFSNINKQIENSLNTTKNVLGGLCYNKSNCKIDSYVTSYYLNYVYDYIKNN